MLAINKIGGIFTERWKSYCQKHSISYLEINIFDNNIIDIIQRENIKVLLFDVSTFDFKNRIAGMSIVLTIEKLGVNVFPGSQELWHFDDKIAQKYLFESLAISNCKTNVFYESAEAKEWARTAQYPYVFKLKCGAGASNVIKVNSFAHANSLIDQMFGAGIKPVPSLFSDLKTKAHKHKKNRDWLSTFKRLPATIRKLRSIQTSIPRERGYTYFQEFLPNNEFDTRVTVIGDRAFGFRRMVRKGDFRASGSGDIDYNADAIDLQFVSLAFTASEKIGARCMAYDLVYDENGSPVILECCYHFIPDAVSSCPGYWDHSLNYHEGNIWPQDCIILDMQRGIVE